MDCMRSFNVRINQLKTLTGAAALKTWGVLGQEYFTVDLNDFSAIDIEGFKNVDIYGFTVIGNVKSHAQAATGGAVVNNWAFKIFLDGTLPLISAKVATVPSNFFGISLVSNSPKAFDISKNTNELKLSSPITSVSRIRFDSLQVEGFGVQTTGTVILEYDFNFTFYYKYEGEE